MLLKARFQIIVKIHAVTALPITIRAHFCFRKIMLEEMCFSQKDIVEANNAAVSGIIFTSID